ncbi:Imm1 family immunity protein [Streptomyces griseoruber]
MILTVAIRDKYEYAETPQDISRLIMEVTCNLDFEKNEDPWISPGEDAWLMWSDRRLEESDQPSNHLRVAVNTSTGYGALTWFVNERWPGYSTSKIADKIWISNNPTPPNFDPRVVADPGFPLFHDPFSTIPVSDVRRALEEFCKAATGDRPKCINWIPGDLFGTRQK